MSNPIAFFEITCRDAAPLVEFYAQMFGWDVNYDAEQKFATVEAGSSAATGMISEIPDNVPAALTVFVKVDSLDAALARAEELGGSTMFPPMELPNERKVAMIVDPAGLAIGLTE
ncbi:MAG: VOC family protein [bacterium]|nr:VOC family protein [Candidatus Kapabacteria bacterium]